MPKGILEKIVAEIILSLQSAGEVYAISHSPLATARNGFWQLTIISKSIYPTECFLTLSEKYSIPSLNMRIFSGSTYLSFHFSLVVARIGEKQRFGKKAADESRLNEPATNWRLDKPITALNGINYSKDRPLFPQ